MDRPVDGRRDMYQQFFRPRLVLFRTCVAIALVYMSFRLGLALLATCFLPAKPYDLKQTRLGGRAIRLEADCYGTDVDLYRRVHRVVSEFLLNAKVCGRLIA